MTTNNGKSSSGNLHDDPVRAAKRGNDAGLGTGAVAGAVAGGVLGSTLGPPGAIVGVILGSSVGAVTGMAISKGLKPMGEDTTATSNEKPADD